MRVKLSDLVKMHQYMVQLDRAKPQDIELELDDVLLPKRQQRLSGPGWATPCWQQIHLGELSPVLRS